MEIRDKAPASDDSGMNRVLVDNIRSLLEKRAAEARADSLQNRVAAAITGFAGSMAFVYLHLAGFGLWIATNLGWLPLPKFDPTFVVLAMFASVEAIFISTFVLISQNRMSAVAERRADLDLQISLLAEHEITRLLQLATAMADKLEIKVPSQEETEELKRDVAADRVLDTIAQETARHGTPMA